MYHKRGDLFAEAIDHADSPFFIYMLQEEWYD